MDLEQILEQIAQDPSVHTRSGPSSEAELVAVEERLGHPLPEPFRRFLARMGGGIYFQRHEIFGSHRVMLHDIEFVTDLFSMLRHIQDGAEGQVGRGRIPVHRAGDEVHVLDVSEGAENGKVISLKDGRAYPDFTVFLESVVMAWA